MKINKQTLKDFRADFKKAVESLEEQYEVEVKMKNISYGDVSFSAKIEVTNGANPEEVAKNSFEDDLNKYGTWFPEITIGHFEKGLNYYGKQIRIVAFRPRSPKFPIIYEQNGKRFKTSYESIKNALSMNINIGLNQ